MTGEEKPKGRVPDWARAQTFSGSLRAVEPAEEGADDSIQSQDKERAEEAPCAPLVIANHGQIATMCLPPGWVAAPPKQRLDIGARSYKEFNPEESSDASLCLFYRGMPVSDPVAHSFSELIAAPAHELSAEEYETMAVVVRDKRSARDFTLSKAQTLDVNRRRVLAVEGRYNQIQEESRHFFIDADGTGRFVQEIYYQGTIDAFALHKKAVYAAMDAIEWKPALSLPS